MSSTARRVGVDGAGQGIAAERAEADRRICRRLARLERQAIVVDHQHGAGAEHHRALLGEVEGDDRDVLLQDVLPDIELGPVRQREDADRFALPDAGVVERPELGALVARVPGMVGGAEGEDALLGAALLLVAAGAAEGRVELVLVERLAQPLGLHHLGVQRRAGGDRVDAAGEAVLIDMDDEIEPVAPRHLVAEGDHVAELPGRVDMEQREGQLAREEGLQREMQHHARILADRIEHHRIGELGRDLADDGDRLGFEPLEMGREGAGHGLFTGGRFVCPREMST